MPDVEQDDIPPDTMPGLSLWEAYPDAVWSVDLTDCDMPFARAAIKFAGGVGPLEDAIREGRELEALREWRALREKQLSGAPETPAASR